ncbi:MAG: efflux RND transporter periplasmic adaptor subunit [Elusimicrobiales bacterium]|nr:efflux RND transporter periplasmic adaptor subunit [Elusimicrobiales bacterium]
MKKRTMIIKIVIFAAVAAGLGAGGWYGWKHYKNGKKAKAADEEDAVTIARGDVSVSFHDVGEVAAKDMVDINSKANGRITELFVQEGQKITKGDKLAIVQGGKTEAEHYVPTTITAPQDGVVMRCVKPNSSRDYSLFAKVGDLVSGSYDSGDPTCIMQIADMSKLVVNMQIGEMDILKLREGMPVEVKVDALPGKTFKGKIGLISPQAERNKEGTKLFRVQIQLSDAGTALKVGMTARVEAVLQSHKNVVVLPLSALFEEKGQSFVYRRVGEGKSEKYCLRLGLRSDTDTEALDTLKEGDKLYIIKPVENVVDKSTGTAAGKSDAKTATAAAVKK